jgi:hypothetical protein
MGSGSRSRTRFTILPPVRAAAPPAFHAVEVNPRRYDQLLANMQRLRGRVYEADGAVRPAELTADGRHTSDVDERSWHVLSIEPDGEVVACLRYLEESRVPSFGGLRIRHAALARCPQEGLKFRRAVESEMERARRVGIAFGEVGGWAVHEDRRWTSESLGVILATYALLELVGSCAGVATATHRHSSAGILQRIGLTSLQWEGSELQPYYDPQYGCLMRILRFDSRFPNPKYSDWISGLMTDLTEAPVICRQAPALAFAVRRADMEPDLNLIPEPVSAGKVA